MARLGSPLGRAQSTRLHLLAIQASFCKRHSGPISNLNHVSESADRRRREYSCRFELDEGAQEINT